MNSSTAFHQNKVTSTTIIDQFANYVFDLLINILIQYIDSKSSAGKYWKYYNVSFCIVEILNSKYHILCYSSLWLSQMKFNYSLDMSTRAGVIL